VPVEVFAAAGLAGSPWAPDDLLRDAPVLDDLAGPLDDYSAPAAPLDDSPEDDPAQLAYSATALPADGSPRDEWQVVPAKDDPVAPLLDDSTPPECLGVG
jgi:hypothetical protein